MEKECTFIEFKTISDKRGKLTVAEAMINVPFEIKRLFYIYGVPAGAERGGHAHKKCEQVFIAVSGKFTAVINKGKKYELDLPARGLYVPAGLWVDLQSVAEDSVILVLCSEPYDEKDYIKNYEELKK